MCAPFTTGVKKPLVLWHSVKSDAIGSPFLVGDNAQDFKTDLYFQNKAKDALEASETYLVGLC